MRSIKGTKIREFMCPTDEKFVRQGIRQGTYKTGDGSMSWIIIKNDVIPDVQ